MADAAFDRLTEADAPAAFDLSARIGWNQSEADWRRVIGLNPEGTVAVRSGGALVATATLASYGRALHWVGMVIVDPAHRGRGLGTAVLDRMVERSRALGGTTLGLDATPLGEPIYRKRGFVPVGPIDRWVGALPPAEAADAAVAPGPGQWEELLELDRRVGGIDRARLLNALRREEEVRAWVVPERGPVRGFAFLRPGREHAHLGPLVATRDEDVATLLRAAGRALGGGSALMDAPREPHLAELLEQLGLEVQRRLVRMTQDRPVPALMGDGIRLATSLEWG